MDKGQVIHLEGGRGGMHFCTDFQMEDSIILNKKKALHRFQGLQCKIKIILFPAELIQSGGETLLSAIHKLINSVWNKETFSGRSLLLYQFTKRLIKPTVIIIVGYHCTLCTFNNWEK
jgi:hypothetical protein